MKRPLCEREEDDNEHMLKCEKVIDKWPNRKYISFEEYISSDNVEELKEIVGIVNQIEEIRIQKRIERRKKKARKTVEESNNEE